MSDMQQTSTVASDSSAREYAGGKMLSARREGIGIVTFNQPQKHNAVSVDMWGGLAEILGEFATDDSIRVVVLTGAGGRAFVSGADISQFDQQRNNADAQRAYDRQTSVGREKLSSFPKPTIAMIRGYCLGGGLAIAMQTDLRIASPESQFGIPAAKLGIAYGLEGLRNLVSLVGPAHARMIMYTGERFGAAEALRIGLINRVVASGELENHVFELAQTIASNAPLSVAASRLTITQLLTDPQERDVDAVVRASAVCFDSEDYREGRAAFLEKRKPQFKGR
ncbi:MAG: enoyl-CoA hydratase/isomerase family protein [Chloroflexi bacterium]|nr:enoyl-CoA hydratase/isomerase family protein [Chloroflexota bacterium]